MSQIVFSTDSFASLDAQIRFLQKSAFYGFPQRSCIYTASMKTDNEVFCADTEGECRSVIFTFLDYRDSECRTDEEGGIGSVSDIFMSLEKISLIIISQGHKSLHKL
ncbi:hypothetical protein Tco_1109801 [Tanacetum coccineum]|uniref:Uncharacterized protein n=1 Tax=Tanacetum coccineum TaxID=301880 RepID=A0ABQ5IJ21_9ASTR